LLVDNDEGCGVTGVVGSGPSIAFSSLRNSLNYLIFTRRWNSTWRKGKLFGSATNVALVVFSLSKQI